MIFVVLKKGIEKYKWNTDGVHFTVLEKQLRLRCK
jgi:hypothetical protein